MTTDYSSLSHLLVQQQQAQLRQPVVSAEQRKDRIQQIINLLVSSHQSLAAAMEADFGGRHPGFSLMNDVLGAMASLKHTRDNLEQWMQPESRQSFSPYDQLGATALVRYQPKGCVGIMGTWNAPLYTLLSPLACVLGAGNRAILKPSEITPRTAETLAEIFDKYIDPNIVAVINGGADLGAHFAAQPFNHLMFTGSTDVGRKIMTAAAEQLTPLTLELGGKSPAIISDSALLEQSCQRLAIAKGTNAGQICVSPDIVYVPEHKLEQTIKLIKQFYAELYPTIGDNVDLTPMVNAAHFNRVESYLEDARSKGCRIESSHEVGSDAKSRRSALRLVINPSDDSSIMQHEIFGSAMVIKSYADMTSVIADINGRSNPLALYYFGEDAIEQETVLANTRAGGVTINDALTHAAMHEAPFGGIGGSGMGHYHGKEGFLAFSHMQTVFTGPKQDPRAEWGMLPPYHAGFTAVMESQITPD